MEYPKITPLGNNVLIERAPMNAQHGLIIIPDAARKPADRGIVAAVGRGRRTDSGALIPCACAVGDVVLFPATLGVEIDVDGKKYTLISDEMITGILDQGAA